MTGAVGNSVIIDVTIDGFDIDGPRCVYFLQRVGNVIKFPLGFDKTRFHYAFFSCKMSGKLWNL